MYFIKVLLHYNFLVGMLHNPPFLYFPRASVLLFIFSQPISIWLISGKLMISNPSYHAPRILEHYKSLEVQSTNLPFQESMVARI